MKTHLPLGILLLGALGRMAESECATFEMWKSVEELARTTSLGIEEDDVVLVQDYMMGTSQLKAPETEGVSWTKTPSMNCEHS